MLGQAGAAAVGELEREIGNGAGGRERVQAARRLQRERLESVGHGVREREARGEDERGGRRQLQSASANATARFLAWRKAGTQS